MTIYQKVIAEVAPELTPLAEAALVAYQTLYEDETSWLTGTLAGEKDAIDVWGVRSFRVVKEVTE